MFSQALVSEKTQWNLQRFFLYQFQFRTVVGSVNRFRNREWKRQKRGEEKRRGRRSSARRRKSFRNRFIRSCSFGSTVLYSWRAAARRRLRSGRRRVGVDRGKQVPIWEDCTNSSGISFSIGRSARSCWTHTAVVLLTEENIDASNFCLRGNGM